MEPHDVVFIVLDEKGEETERTFTMTLTSIPTPGNCFDWNNTDYFEVHNTKLEGDTITVYVKKTRRRR